MAPSRSRSVWVALAIASLSLGACGATGRASPSNSTPSSSPRATASPASGASRSKADTSKAVESLTTYHYGNSRQGLDTHDPSFRHIAEAWETAGSKIDGAIYAEPLIDGGKVYVATEDDLLYALNAKTGGVEWKLRVGSPAQSSSVQGAPGLSQCGDIFPLGITGTPVIDTSTKTLYLAAEVQKSHTSTWTGVEHVMAAIDLSDHRLLWTKEIDPPHSGDGDNGTYIIAAEQQRSALSLVDGRVYVEYGGLSGDCSAYHGYVVSLPTSGKPPLGVYTTPSQREDAIWATSGAASDSSGDLFVATGNGSDNDTTFKMDNAVIELSPSLKVVSYFGPSAWSAMNDDDLDLGSDGPTVLPGGKLVFESGKAGFAKGDGGANESWGYILRVNHLGGVGHPAFRGQVCPNAGFVFGANATEVLKVDGHRETLVFVPCPTGTVALKVTEGSRPSFRRVWEASSGDPNGPPIVAGGLVWAISTGNDGGGSPANVLSGMSPTTGKVLVKKAIFQGVVNFVTPAAADGEIVVGTSAGVEAFKPAG